jgi:hypothetical protein
VQVLPIVEHFNGLEERCLGLRAGEKLDLMEWIIGAGTFIQKFCRFWSVVRDFEGGEAEALEADEDSSADLGAPMASRGMRAAVPDREYWSTAL